MGVTFDPSH